MYRITSLFFLLAGVSSSALASIDSMEADWKAFRTAYPYHIQVVALSHPDETGSRTLIISEPPPTIKADEIGQIAPEAFANIRFFRQVIGFDGWAQDAVIELKPLSDSQLGSLIDNLHVRLFGTAYKAIAVSIPSSPRVNNHDYNFDLRVSAGTLKRWLLPDVSQRNIRWVWLGGTLLVFVYAGRLFGSNRRKRHFVAAILVIVCAYTTYGKFAAYGRGQQDAIYFRPAFSGDLTTVESLLDTNKHGVFYSKDSGLVLWVFPKSSLSNSARAEIRRFALDSDIILGSVGNASSVAIVARERVAPIDVLPPLRTETILQLAAVKDSELSQSYERNSVFAGNYDGNDDWAPIYLSDELIDTEYGSLLNITDQLLKSWSMNGKVRYINFRYPEPARYPFPEPLAIYAKANEITFNWNTKGAGYSSPFGQFDVFAWTRTGALPVDYLGNRDARLHAAEDTGYDYFASMSDPNLVRVVQYAELYQIFRHYRVEGPTLQVNYHAAPSEVIRKGSRLILAKVATFSDEQVQVLTQLAGSGPGEDISSCRENVVDLHNRIGESALDQMAEVLAAPRKYTKQLEGPDNDPNTAIAKAALQCQSTVRLLGVSDEDTVDAIRREYVAESARAETGWIRTPSIVVSRAYDELAGGTGGHNLDSAVTLLRPSGELNRGEVKVVEENGQRILEYSSQDTDRIQESVRPVAREHDLSAAELEAKARESLATAKPDTRPLSETLNFTSEQRPSLERGFEPEHARGYAEKDGWWTSDGRPSDDQSRLVAALNSPSRHTVVIERNGSDGFAIFDGPRRQILHASTKPGAMDAVLALVADNGAPGAKVHVHFRGFDVREARGFVENAKFQAEGDLDGPGFAATVEEGDFDPNLLKSILEEKYDFRRAEIKNVEKFVAEDGTTGWNLDAQVPSLGADRPPLLVRIKIFLQQGVEFTADLLQTIQAAIRDTFSMHAVLAPDDRQMMTDTFVKTLLKADPRISHVEVEEKISKEGKDVHIALNRQPADAFVAG